MITLVYTDTDGKIKGAYEWGLDTGTQYLFWVNDENFHCKEIPGETDWSDVDDLADWPKENLTSADWHTMREAGGALVVCNAQYLAMVGYDGSYTNEALDLVPGNLAKTIVERNGRSIVGTIRASDSIGINGAIESEISLVQVGEDGEVYLANGIDTVPIKTFPGGGYVNPGGVCSLVDQVNFFEWEQTALSWIDKQGLGNLALFGVFGADSDYGGIYSYGRKNKNHIFAMNLEYELDVDEIGAIASVDGVVIASYQDGETYGVKAVDSTTKATGTYYGLDFKAPTKKPINITNWKQAEIFCYPLPSGTSIEFHYKTDKSGDFIQAKTADGDTEFDTADGQKAVFQIATDGEIFEPCVILNPTSNLSPEVYRIRVYFN